MHYIETDVLRAELHPRGAALSKLVYKPLDHNLVISCPVDRRSPRHYCNTVVGPVANRVAGARFEIDGEDFYLDRNEGSSCLHGGSKGLSELDWHITEDSENTISYILSTKDGYMGFPGPSQFRVTYMLDRHRLSITLEASSPRSNYFNLTPHLYFNLDGSDWIDEHWLQINADSYLPTDSYKRPTGEIKSVEDSGYDFRQPRPISSDQIDHNFCLNGSGLREVASLRGVNGLALTFSTDQPGLQIYTAEHLGRTHVATEMQAWPNAANETNFPSQITRPGKIYRSTNRFEFHSSAIRPTDHEPTAP